MLQRGLKSFIVTFTKTEFNHLRRTCQPESFLTILHLSFLAASLAVSFSSISITLRKKRPMGCTGYRVLPSLGLSSARCKANRSSCRA